MPKTYDLVFPLKSGLDLKVLSFTVHDDRFKDYFIDTIMSNLEYDIADLDSEFDIYSGQELYDFTIIEKETE